jgi:hypothetical protein
MDMSVMDTGKYRKLVINGYICRPWPGGPGPELMNVLGLEIVYLLMYFWTLNCVKKILDKNRKAPPRHMNETASE